MGSVVTAAGASLVAAINANLAHKLIAGCLTEPVRICHSPHPCSGKTRAIRMEAMNQKLLYSCVRVTTDMPALREQLARALGERLYLAPDQGMAIHFNVSHAADFQQFNNFLFEFLVFGNWADEEGAVHTWDGKLDRLFIEIPSEGCPRDSMIPETLPFCKALQALPITEEVGLLCPTLRLLPESEFLYEVHPVEESSMAVALQWLHAFHANKTVRMWPDMLDVPQNAQGTIDASKLLVDIMDDEDNKIEVKHGGNRQLRFFQKIRLLKFLGPQFQRLAERDAEYVPVLEAEELPDHRMLRWLLVQLMVRAAGSVAVSAVDPPELADPSDFKSVVLDH
eukprot:5165110-Amphidinium_carterae.1